MSKLAFGCSHTYGIGVKPNEAWPALLGAVNHGVPGCSSDLVARISSTIIKESAPSVVYVLWPDYTRFEYKVGDGYNQSLATDSNRINFMETATEDWLVNNFNEQVQKVKDTCKLANTKLVDMTLYDLIPYIDHADRWPLSVLGHHYSPVWHTWVAEIFKNKEND